MSAPRCGLHGVPIHNATLCPQCVSDVERDLGDIAALIDELDVTLSRQDRIDRNGKADTDPDAALPLTAKVQPLAYNANASDVRDDLKATLVGWALDIHTEGDEWPADNETAISRWLLVRLEEIRQHPAGDQIRDEITYSVSQVRRVVDRPVSLVFAGPCLEPVDGGRCVTDLYAKPDRETVVCSGCGSIHDLRERQAWLLAQADDQLAHAELIGRAAPALGIDITPAAIRGYAQRGRIIPHGTDFQGRPLYRVGDVIDVARDVLTRRSEQKERGRRAS